MVGSYENIARELLIIAMIECNIRKGVGQELTKGLRGNWILIV
jgi:hypothetical protein